MNLYENEWFSLLSMALSYVAIETSHSNLNHGEIINGGKQTMRRKMIRLLPNTLSAMRFPLGIAFAVMIAFRFSGKTISLWSLIISFAMIGLSDLLDGWIARKFNCQANIGAILDVSADSFYILLSLVVSNYYHIVPIWFTGIVILKLVVFILSSRIFSICENSYFVFDFLGKFTAAGFYLLPILAGIFLHNSVIHAATLFLTFTAVCSSILRWFTFPGISTKNH